MKIGLVSDSLAHLPLPQMLDAAKALGIEGLELATGNWSSAPHLDLQRLLGSADARQRFREEFTRRDLELIALNCSGNPLHPVDGGRQTAITYDTIRLAGELGLSTVVMMSGLPGGAPGDATPNWIVSSWPPETQTILAWQWQERLLPFWTDLVAHASAHGVTRLALELRGNQLVYNVPTLMRLRAAVGDVVGANLDPSHLLWMGADPLAAVDALGPAICHVHAKDTFINAPRAALTSRLENGSLMDIAGRAWSYITLGYGQDESWWRAFCYRLRMVGYEGWLSIEHEDVLLARLEGVERSVALLRAVAPIAAGDFLPQPA